MDLLGLYLLHDLSRELLLFLDLLLVGEGDLLELASELLCLLLLQDLLPLLGLRQPLGDGLLVVGTGW